MPLTGKLGVHGLAADIMGGQGGVQLLDQAFSGLTETIKKVVDAFNPSGIISSITELRGAITGFVNAISPATMQQVDWAFRELNATIGQALLPVAQILADTLRQVAGALNPVIQQLTPVIARLASLLGGAVVAIAELIGSVLDALMPIFEALVDALTPLIDLVKVLAAAFSAVMTAMKPLIVLFTDVVIKPFVEALKWATKSLILFTAALAKTFGADKFVADLVENLTKKPGTTANAAPQGAAIKSLEAIMKDIQTGAFVAGGLGEQKTSDDFLKDIIKELEEINKGKMTLEDVVIKGVYGGIKKWLDEKTDPTKHEGDSGFMAKALEVGGPFLGPIRGIRQAWQGLFGS